MLERLAFDDIFFRWHQQCTDRRCALASLYRRRADAARAEHVVMRMLNESFFSRSYRVRQEIVRM